jgi:3-isopropylmalate/(R)-2-methylmalate dehydratase large subunit
VCRGTDGKRIHSGQIKIQEVAAMGMTMTQKILAAHAGLDSVTAGQLIEAKLDIVMANDITGPMALPIFREMAEKVYDKDKVVLVPDHFTPNKDIKSAQNSKRAGVEMVF